VGREKEEERGKEGVLLIRGNEKGFGNVFAVKGGEKKGAAGPQGRGGKMKRSKWANPLEGRDL